MYTYHPIVYTHTHTHTTARRTVYGLRIAGWFSPALVMAIMADDANSTVLYLVNPADASVRRGKLC